MMNLLDHASFLERPRRLEPPFPWVEHCPFAFLVIELLRPQLFVELGVHSGNSYNVFCQAVSSLQTGSKCFGVDTWKGDEHAGFYQETVYRELLGYQEREYAEFSSLLRMTFDEALDSFSEGSVDLLHIDGLHTYEAVRHDFEAWLPKVSDRGVVLFHDTQVRLPDFGVWRLWEEIAPAYPSFEFTHGHGLGIVAVGSKAVPAVLEFLEAARGSRAIQRLFHRLGNAITLEQEIVGLQARLAAQRSAPAPAPEIAGGREGEPGAGGAVRETAAEDRLLGRLISRLGGSFRTGGGKP